MAGCRRYVPCNGAPKVDIGCCCSDAGRTAAAFPLPAGAAPPRQSRMRAIVMAFCEQCNRRMHGDVEGGRGHRHTVRQG